MGQERGMWPRPGQWEVITAVEANPYISLLRASCLGGFSLSKKRTKRRHFVAASSFLLGKLQWGQMLGEMAAMLWPRRKHCWHNKDCKTKTQTEPGSLTALLNHETAAEASNQTYFYMKELNVLCFKPQLIMLLLASESISTQFLDWRVYSA